EQEARLGEGQLERRDEASIDVHDAAEIVRRETDEHYLRLQRHSLAQKAQIGLVEAVAADAIVQNFQIIATRFEQRRPRVVIGHLVAVDEGIAKSSNAERGWEGSGRIVPSRTQALR